jgi:hypothetical protein
MVEMDEISITARELGQVLLDDFCKRCFWFTKNFPLDKDHPFRAPIPGISSQIDSYTKQVVITYLKRNGGLPSWVINKLNCSFQELDFYSIRDIYPKTWKVSPFDRCTLTGRADAIWEFKDGSLFIADYKTASLTKTQDRLFPLYQAQLNAYAYLAHKSQGKTISGLALLYFEPEYKGISYEQLLQRTEEKLMLGFRCTVVPVSIEASNWVENLCQEIFHILSSKEPPESTRPCCQALFDWLIKIGKHLPRT